MKGNIGCVNYVRVLNYFDGTTDTPRIKFATRLCKLIARFFTQSVNPPRYHIYTDPLINSSSFSRAWKGTAASRLARDC